MPGHHRGMLAGLTGTARADALEQSVATARSEIELSDLLGGLAAKGPRATSLFDCLMTWKKDRLAGCARGLQIKGVASKKKAVIAEAITERVASTPELPRAMLALLTSAGIEAAATLYREGGAIALDKGNRSDYLPLCFSIYAFPFNEDGRFVAVMPDEIRKLFDDTDFDTAMELRATYEKITRLADSAVSMRGVTTTRELYAEFDKRWPQTCTQTEFVTVLNLLQSEQTGPFDIFFSAERNTSVLVDRSLSYEALVSVEDPDADLDDVLLADRNIAYLLEQHEKRAAAPVPDALIEEGDYLYWAYTIPAVDALREFLDEQVPDGCDDYLFTDDAMMTLLDMAHGGYQLDRYFEVLAEMGFEPEQGYLQHISNLLINMLSVSPRWDDNGWSFLEIEGLGTPSKTFLNENGTVVKVGRNDPCPCGSGKKYKKCHGR